MKLIYEHYFTDGYTYGNTVVFPFEYSSKDDFVLEILNRIDNAKDLNRTPQHSPIVYFLGLEISLNDDFRAEDVEKNVYTLEEWFDQDKRDV